MLLIALTGGIGSGKSTAAGFFRQCGAEVIEADELAREVVSLGSVGLAAVRDHFGDGVIQSEGSLNREALARIVFGDAEQRAELEKIVHPLVAKSFRQRLASISEDAVVIYEIPLLAEGGRSEEFQLVIAIETPLSLRIERMSKRGFTDQQSMSRIADQASNDDRRTIADIVLPNSGDAKSLEHAVRSTWELRLRPFAANLAAEKSAEPEWTHDDLLPNLLPLESQIIRIANRVADAIEGKVSVCSMTELRFTSGARNLASKLKHLGFIETEPGRWFTSADPGRPLRLVVSEL
jgi:dephospho-CoA kinase